MTNEKDPSTRSGGRKSEDEGRGVLLYVGLLGVAVALIGSYILPSILGFFGSSGLKGDFCNLVRDPSSSILTDSPLRYPGSVDSGSTTQFVGNKTYYPSFGIYPKDCRWRPVTEKGNSTFEYVW